MADTTARLKAQKKYDELHKNDYKSYFIKCNKVLDADIIEYMEAQSNKQGALKELIRKEIRS